MKFIKIVALFLLGGGLTALFPQVSSAAGIRQPVFNCQAKEPVSAGEYVNFESDPVRTLARSADGRLLFVANTAADCLEIFRVNGPQMHRISALAVGMDPVAVAVRNDNEVWVVNHMSDSVSIISLDGKPHISRTLQVGDEPRDIVFAGSGKSRAFITTAHRGQDHPDFTLDDLRTPGMGRADVWVYEAADPGVGLSGQPLTILSLFTDTPRALAVSADGRTVYAAGFLSGNQTTVIMPPSVTVPKAGPHDSLDGVADPGTGLIVRFDGEHWLDEQGVIYDDQVLFNLPDRDVFEIDAAAEIPVITGSYSGVGTVLFNMAVNPVSGTLYVSNTEALNEVRFEGPGIRGTSVRGHFSENRITSVRGGEVVPHHLNPHVDFSLPMGTESSPSVKEHSTAQPMDMVVSADGNTLYVAAFGSAQVVAIDTAVLERGEYDPYSSVRYDVPGGPSGLMLSSDGRYLYVFSRFEQRLSVLDLQQQRTLTTAQLYNPEPGYIREGRPLLYDARYTSGNGTVSCAGCHVFGDLDGLAWDLGNPDANVAENPLEESSGNLAPLKSRTFHPLKGPMTTQTFRGIALSGPMHWRGDRTGEDRQVVRGELESVEAAAFKEFNDAFVALVGRGEVLPENDLQKLTDFALSISSRPNPVANLDGSLTARQLAGKEDYFNAALDRGVSSCNSCHKIDATLGLFGTDKKITSEGPLVSQDFKIPHLRNMYQKVGMFGTSYLTQEHMGDQVRGFGYGHDGTFASVDDFLTKLGGFVFSDADQSRRIAEFVFAFPAEQASVVGQQVTLTSASGSDADERLDLLEERQAAEQCDLIFSGRIFGLPVSGQRDEQGIYRGGWLPAMSSEILRFAAGYNGNGLTFTCVPRGTGRAYSMTGVWK